MGGVEKIQEQKPQILVAKTPVYSVYLADPGIWGEHVCRWTDGSEEGEVGDD